MNKHLENTVCPSCNHVLEVATGLEEGTQPVPGDVSICLYCASVNRFNEDFSLTEMTESDMLNDLDQDVFSQIVMAKASILSRCKK